MTKEGCMNHVLSIQKHVMKIGNYTAGKRVQVIKDTPEHGKGFINSYRSG